MKKIFILAICSVVLLSACGNNAETVPQQSVSENSVQEYGTEEESYDLWEKMHQAESQAANFLESEEYLNADKEKKIEMALNFVGKLKDDGLIANYDYFKENAMISYTHLNGVQGGISFFDFDWDIDGLAIN